MRRSVVISVLIFLIAGCGSAKIKSMEVYRQGLTLQREGKNPEALALYQKSIEIYEKNIPAHQSYQDILILQGKKEDALGKYKARLNENPRESTCNYLYGRLLGWENGKEYFKKSISLNKKFAWGYYALGQSLMLEKKYADAAAEFEKSIELDPEIAEVHLQLGRAYAMRGKLGDAEQEFKRVIEIDPASPDGYLYLGNISLITGNINEAATNYGKALEIAPSSGSALNAMGKIYLIRGNTGEAIKVFEKVLSQRPSDPWSSLNVARALYLGEKQGEAVKFFKQGIKQSPHMPEAHYLLALAYMDAKSWQDARNELATVERLNPKAHGIHKARALICLANGDESGAEKELLLEEKINSRDPETYYIRGQIFYRRAMLSQILKAEEQFKNALAMDSRYYPAYLGLGQIEADWFREYGRAVRVYQEALVIFPGDIEITYRIGRCYSLWGQDKPAIEYFRKAFELGMDDWKRIDGDTAIQGMKYMPEISELLDTYRKKPRGISKTKHSELISTSDLIFNQINHAYKTM